MDLNGIIALANTKGGVGKSTLAGNLAWVFDRLEHNVALVDADIQASATKWFDLAADGTGFERYQATTARLLHQQLPRLRRRHDLVIIDCPPMQSDVTAAALGRADLGLIPIQPSPLDVMAYAELIPLLHQAQAFNPSLYLRFVVNQVDRRANLARDIEESLRDTEIGRLNTSIADRQAYRRAVLAGTSAAKLDRAAAVELEALAHEILHVLKTKSD